MKAEYEKWKTEGQDAELKDSLRRQNNIQMENTRSDTNMRGKCGKSNTK